MLMLLLMMLLLLMPLLLLLACGGGGGRIRSCHNQQPIECCRRRLVRSSVIREPRAHYAHVGFGVHAQWHEQFMQIKI